MDTEKILISLLQGQEGETWAKEHKGWQPVEYPNEYYCYWDGIHCDKIDKETIIGIFLPSTGIRGTLPSELGLLVNLRELSLPDNQIYGTIPQEVANLPHLKIINLSKNKLTGTIPLFASPAFQSMDLSANDLSGSLPDDFGKRHERMTDFDLSENKLEGRLPDSISFMTLLDEISLSNNRLSGTIPVSIGYLRNLRYIYLNDNFFMGSIPSTIVRFSSPLAELWLQENLLSGTIPAVTADMTELFNFYIDGNKFTGTIPKELCKKELNADFFEGAKADKNRNYCESIACKSGYVSEYGIYPCVECEQKFYNPYLGRIGSCIDLDQRDILEVLYDATGGDQWKDMTRHDWVRESRYYCSFSGITCDESLNVVAIDLKGRGLKGTIPEEIGFLRYLERLDLSDNMLTGYIPSDLRWAPLQHLDLSNNKLKGVVPPTLCLKDGINGNGEEGLFDCDRIACDIGFYSATGSGNCNICNYGGEFLGSKICRKASSLSHIHHLVPSKNNEDDGISYVSFIFALLATFTIIYFAVSSFVKRRRARLYVAHALPNYEI